MENLLIEEKSFESERKVVLEERKMRYENSPSGKLFLKMMQTVFEGTPTVDLLLVMKRIS